MASQGTHMSVGEGFEGEKDFKRWRYQCEGAFQVDETGEVAERGDL